MLGENRNCVDENNFAEIEAGLMKELFVNSQLH